jgi:hypothetical protein
MGDELIRVIMNVHGNITRKLTVELPLSKMSKSILFSFFSSFFLLQKLKNIMVEQVLPAVLCGFDASDTREVAD